MILELWDTIFFGKCLHAFWCAYMWFFPTFLQPHACVGFQRVIADGKNNCCKWFWLC